MVLFPIFYMAIAFFPFHTFHTHVVGDDTRLVTKSRSSFVRTIVLAKEQHYVWWLHQPGGLG